MRVLFAEDEPTIRECVTRRLDESGHAVDTFARGDEAWLAVRAADHDVAILDFGLPGLDGFELCRRIRARTGPGSVLTVVEPQTSAARTPAPQLPGGGKFPHDL